jgi:hypothetical protein
VHPDKPDLAGWPRPAIAEHMLEQIGTGREARTIAALCHNFEQFSAKLVNGNCEHPF